MEFIVAVEDPRLRSRLVRILRSIQKEPVSVGGADVAYRLNPQQLNQGWLLLETGDDAHRLTQVVNDLHYSPWFEGGSVHVTCFVSRSTFKRNPGLGFWLIAGSAAVGGVWTEDTPDGEIAAFLKRLATPVSKETQLVNVPEISTTVQALADAPDQASAWLEVAEFLVEDQDLWKVRRKLAAALLHQAVKLDPSCVRARIRLAKVLFWDSQHSAAIEECQTAIRLDPECAEAHYQLGAILGLSRDPERGRPHLETAIRLAGDSLIGVWAKNYLAGLDAKQATKWKP